MSFNDALKYAVAIAVIYAAAWVWVTIEDFTGGNFDGSAIWEMIKLLGMFALFGMASWKLYPRATPETRERARLLGGLVSVVGAILVVGFDSSLKTESMIPLGVVFAALFFLISVTCSCALAEILERIAEWRATFNQSETVSAYAGAQASSPSGAATSHGFDPSRFKKGGKEARHPDDARYWQAVDNPNATDKEKKIAQCRIREAEAIRRLKAAEERVRA